MSPRVCLGAHEASEEMKTIETGNEGSGEKPTSPSRAAALGPAVTTQPKPQITTRTEEPAAHLPSLLGRAGAQLLLDQVLQGTSVRARSSDWAKPVRRIPIWSVFGLGKCMLSLWSMRGEEKSAGGSDGEGVSHTERLHHRLHGGRSMEGGFVLDDASEHQGSSLLS